MISCSHAMNVWPGNISTELPVFCYQEIELCSASALHVDPMNSPLLGTLRVSAMQGISGKCLETPVKPVLRENSRIQEGLVYAITVLRIQVLVLALLRASVSRVTNCWVRFAPNAPLVSTRMKSAIGIVMDVLPR